MPIPVDIVFTYVHGEDPAHARRRAGVGCRPGGAGETVDERGKSRDGLYDDVGEITFSVRSALRSMPWIRRAYVVTDRQTPPVDASLLDSGRVRVVDHAEIVPPEYLPSFNSTAIESCLHRIAGLSDVFLYDNDDYFHFRAIPESAFYGMAADGSVRLQLCAYRAAVRRLIHRAAGVLPICVPANAHTLGISAACRILQARYARLGWREIIAPRHMTVVCRRSTAARLEDECGDGLHACRSQKLRTKAIVSYFTMLYTMERQWHPSDGLRYTPAIGGVRGFRMFDFRSSRSAAESARLWRKVLRSDAGFVCLNNMKPFESPRFAATMRAKGLGEPLPAGRQAPHRPRRTRASEAGEGCGGAVDVA